MLFSQLYWKKWPPRHKFKRQYRMKTVQPKLLSWQKIFVAPKGAKIITNPDEQGKNDS